MKQWEPNWVHTVCTIMLIRVQYNWKTIMHNNPKRIIAHTWNEKKVHIHNRWEYGQLQSVRDHAGRPAHAQARANAGFSSQDLKPPQLSGEWPVTVKHITGGVSHRCSSLFDRPGHRKGWSKRFSRIRDWSQTKSDDSISFSFPFCVICSSDISFCDQRRRTGLHMKM